MLMTRAMDLGRFAFQFAGGDRDPVEGLLTAQQMQELLTLAWLKI
jgi:hypothetical protein